MNWIINHLIEEKKKITTQREEISDWIINHKKVFCVQDIISDCKGIDRVSIYRTIELFGTLDILHPVFQKNGEQYYELHEPKKHHHHIVCDGCQKTTCVPCTVSKKIIIKGFKKIHHVVSFRGLCKKCF